MIEFLKSDKFYAPIIYIIMGIISYNIIKILINKISKNKHINNKKMTIISLVKNIIKYLIYIFMILSILNVYGVDTSSIVASIGIAGVVIGLAFQDILADFLAGVFILFDNKYSIGDIVEINGFKGEVIYFGLMSTKIKNALGEIKIINNSNFKELTNFSMNNFNLLIDLEVSYNTDIDKLEKVLKELEEEVLKMDNVKKYSLLGINDFSSSSIKYLVSIECSPNKQYQIKRDYFKLIRKSFCDNNIEIPYNQMDIHIRSNNE